MSEYIKHITEDQKDSRKNGDVQIIIAGEKCKGCSKGCKDCRKVGKKDLAKKMK